MLINYLTASNNTELIYRRIDNFIVVFAVVLVVLLSTAFLAGLWSGLAAMTLFLAAAAFIVFSVYSIDKASAHANRIYLESISS